MYETNKSNVIYIKSILLTTVPTQRQHNSDDVFHNLLLHFQYSPNKTGNVTCERYTVVQKRVPDEHVDHEVT